MAYNAPQTYGVDLACLSDADVAFSSVTGVPLVVQNAYHRMTTDSVCSMSDPNGPATPESNACTNWGFNVNRLLGQPSAQAQASGGLIEAALLKDQEIQSAKVAVNVTPIGGVAKAGSVSATCVTAQGPFTIVVDIADLTWSFITGQGS